MIRARSTFASVYFVFLRQLRSNCKTEASECELLIRAAAASSGAGNNFPVTTRNVTVLHAAAAGGCMPGLTQLVDLGTAVAPSIDVRDDFDQTPMYAAAVHGHVDAVNFLLDKGADVLATSSNDRGATALIAAARMGHCRAVSALLSHKASARCKRELLEAHDAQGDTALLVAAGEAQCKETLQVLIAAGANKGAKNAKGKTAKQLATERGKADFAAML
jgi:ankyrin repeat protein